MITRVALYILTRPMVGVMLRGTASFYSETLQDMIFTNKFIAQGYASALSVIVEAYFLSSPAVDISLPLAFLRKAKQRAKKEKKYGWL